MRRHVEVDGALELERNGVACARVEAEGRTVSLRLSDAQAAVAIVRDLRGAGGHLRTGLRHAVSLLVAADLALEVRIGDRRVARAGAGARGGTLEKLLRVDAVEIHALAALLALIGR